MCGVLCTVWFLRLFHEELYISPKQLIVMPNPNPNPKIVMPNMENGRSTSSYRRYYDYYKITLNETKKEFDSVGYGIGYSVVT